MGALLKLILCFYVLTLIFGCFVAMIRFFIDVGKWHDKEKPVVIVSSNEWKEVKNLGRYGSYNNDRGTEDRDGDRDNDSGTGDGDGDNDNNRREPLDFG